MKNKVWLLKFGVILLIAAGCASAFGKTPDDDTGQLRRLAAGAFPSEGSNALFKNYLAQGETNLRAKTGETAGENSTGVVRRQEAHAVPDGSIDFSKIFPNKKRAIAYAYTQINAPNQISVLTENIKQFTLDLNEKLVETDKPVIVKVNNQTAFQGELPNSKRLTLRLEKSDFVQLFDEAENGQTRLAAELNNAGRATRFFTFQKPRLQKTSEIYGRISDAFNTPFLFVVGTKGNDKQTIALNEAAKHAAESLVREWMMRAEGIAEIKRDVDVNAEDINSRNLILFGNANTNAIIAEINDKLPVKFNGANISANGQKVSGEDLGMILIAPNPLQTNRYAVVVGGTTAQSFETASRLNFNELPDFVIFDKQTLAGEKIDFVGGGFFNKFWELEKMSQIGRGK